METLSYATLLSGNYQIPSVLKEKPFCADIFSLVWNCKIVSMKKQCIGNKMDNNCTHDRISIRVTFTLI
jgi:hypothetical protein